MLIPDVVVVACVAVGEVVGKFPKLLGWFPLGRDANLSL